MEIDFLHQKSGCLMSNDPDNYGYYEEDEMRLSRDIRRGYLRAQDKDPKFKAFIRRNQTRTVRIKSERAERKRLAENQDLPHPPNADNHGGASHKEAPIS